LAPVPEWVLGKVHLLALLEAKALVVKTNSKATDEIGWLIAF